MRYSLLPVLVFITTTSFAQGYLQDDPRWRVRSTCGPPPCIAYDTYRYFTAGDSLVQGEVWTKVWRDGSIALNWQGPQPVDPGCQGTSSYGPAQHGVYLIRQVGRELRIWVNDTDELLYDFDLVVGDTLPLSWNNWNSDITVVSVDSVLIGTSMRARFQLGNSWAQYLIEGVGTSHGLFEPVSNFFDCGYELECFGLGDEAFYPSTGPACDLAMGVHGTRKEAWVMAPNPAFDRVMISTTNGSGWDGITVRDAAGRIVRRYRPAGAGTFHMPVENLTNGSYTLQVGQGLPQKLLVLH